MARSEAQSDFSVSRPPGPAEIDLPAAAGPVALPDAEAGLAGAVATRWIMRLTLLMLLALAVLCAVGPHIPSGE
jgi:hypothetical protein